MAFPGVKKKSKRKSTVPAGAYNSVVTGVRDAEGYSKGQAIVITYEFKKDSGEGKVYTFEELFLNDLENPRTEAFDNYLGKNGVVLNGFGDLVGLKEKLTLEKQVRSGRSFMNIVSREFVAWEA